MRIAITGSSGMIGSALTHRLRAVGHEVVGVSRRGGVAGTIAWDPERGRIDATAFEGLDAVVHLAGEPIGARRWSAEQKRRILESRERSTELLARTLAALDDPPRRLLSGSAIGFYGNRGDEVLDEDSSSGDGFLAEVCRRWEAAAGPAIDAGISTAFLRTGIVLSSDGGALQRQLLPFKLGFGGRSGSGRQWQSWIHVDDEIGAIEWLLDHHLDGPVNLTAPNPVRNVEFAKELAGVLHRPSTVIPRIGPRLLLGRELADTLLLDSQRVVPKRLTGGGFEFRFTDLRAALVDLLD